MDENGIGEQKKTGQLLLARLERISADSPWAHQASGVRASLARAITARDPDPEFLEQLLLQGFRILEAAASEIPDPSEGSD